MTTVARENISKVNCIDLHGMATHTVYSVKELNQNELLIGQPDKSRDILGRQ